jgi:hypothetical protein
VVGKDSRVVCTRSEYETSPAIVGFRLRRGYKKVKGGMLFVKVKDDYSTGTCFPGGYDFKYSIVLPFIIFAILVLSKAK